MNVISLIISILMLFVLYYIFENYNLKIALITNGIYGVIVSIFNNGFNILAILLGIVVIVFETLILYKIYTSSNSFGQFIKKVTLIALVIAVILILISLIISSLTSPKF